MVAPTDNWTSEMTTSRSYLTSAGQRLVKNNSMKNGVGTAEMVTVNVLAQVLPPQRSLTANPGNPASLASEDTHTHLYIPMQNTHAYT